MFINLLAQKKILISEATHLTLSWIKPAGKKVGGVNFGKRNKNFVKVNQTNKLVIVLYLKAMKAGLV